MAAGPSCGLAVCLNPAWQKTLSFSRLRLGEVNRAGRRLECGGGKGVNAARAALIAGGRVAVALFAGGDTGARLLAELEATGIEVLAVRTGGVTRTCTTVVDEAGGTVTELIEPTEPVSPDEVEALGRRLLGALPRMGAVALCGTVPPGVADGFYAELAGAARRQGARVLLDGVTRVGPTLEAGVDLLKVNAMEVCALGGESDLRRAAATCRARWGVSWVGITDGPRPAYLLGPTGAWRYELPPLRDARSPIGAGDAATGVLLRHLGDGPLAPAGVVEAFADALAAASASCLTETPAGYEPTVALRLRAGLRVTALTTAS